MYELVDGVRCNQAKISRTRVGSLNSFILLRSSVNYIGSAQEEMVLPLISDLCRIIADI